ncbi:MAG: tetratricopeptide repeat protein [Crenarchaeota archaeon]|nr:tetratricopeptide repeat protein [Thermoproteota archaeon]MDW8033862.1 tetratricopeptide repeat protein [Nitrososphaerota archaeon]
MMNQMNKKYDSGCSDLLVNKAYSLYSMGRFEDAIKYCDEVIKTNPNDATAWSIKGICLQFLRRYEEALSCCEKAISLNPEDASAWYNKASSEEALGKKEDAIKSYNKFISLAPEGYAMYIQYARWRIQVLSGEK